jgi:hypothetical protein
MRSDHQQLVQALRDLPDPLPRPGFVDRALLRAVAGPPRTSWFAHALASWETWLGVTVGAAIATLLTLWLVHPTSPVAGDPIALTVNEVRSIDVVIESERELRNATIRVAAIGGIELDGFSNERQLDWTADLRRGSNLLTLPVLARSSGKGVLIAMIEHGGEQRSVTVNVRVRDGGSSKS